MKCFIKFQEGHGFRSDPDPSDFTAKSRAGALKRAAEILGIGSLSSKAFDGTGAKAVFFGSEQIYPVHKEVKATPKNALRQAAKIYAESDWHRLSFLEQDLVRMLEELGYLKKNRPADGFVGKAAQTQ